MSQTAQRTPLGFVDNTGYVTAFNGRIVDNLPGRYIYTQREMDFYLEEQRRMEAERDAIRYGETPSPNTDANENGVAPPPPSFNPAALVPPPPPTPAAIAQPADTYVPPTHANLTPEQMALLQGGVNANTAAAKVFSTK